MNSLSIDEIKAGKMSEIEDLSLEAIKKALKGETSADDDTIKVAVKMMGVVAKNRQTLTHRRAIDFSMAVTVGNEKQLETYIKVTNPEVQKALGSKK